MKSLLLSALFFLGCEITFAQESSNIKTEDLVYTSAEVKPEFPGGIEEFYNYIGPKFKKPDVKSGKAKIITRFVVEKDGSLSHIEVLKDVGDTAEELTRVLQNSPKWKPGVQNGTVVRVSYIIPISLQ